MVTRTFLDKTNTIIRDTDYNYGLHPISMLNYGTLLSRILIHFDVEKLKRYVEDKTYCDITKLKHVLKMKNCGSVNNIFKQTMVSSDIKGVKERATSFTLIAFKVPKRWDEGIGFDNANDFWIIGKSATSRDGSSWYNATNEETWDEEGIYSTDTLFQEYQNFKNGNESIVIAEQHFDHGNEDLELDLTEYVNELITNELEENNGICICFVPTLEDEDTQYTQYVGFFNNKTNTVFNPVLETRYDCDISDDRMTFALNKENKLYLYSFINGALENLDYLPVCRIERPTCTEGQDVMCEVEQESKGIYSAKVKLTSPTFKKNTVLYDTWTNLYYQDQRIDDAELEFAIHDSKIYFSVGNETAMPKTLNPIISGINDNEKINRGEERIVKVFFKIPYTNVDYKLCDNCWYRIYLRDGERDVTVVDWDRILKMDKFNFFMVKTDEFVPTEYHVDIKAKFGDEIRIFKSQLTFKIASDTLKQKM